MNKDNNFLVQGSILAAAGIFVRLIGLLYKIPMTIFLGDEGIGYYNTAYEIYNIGLILSSYSLPLAMSKLIAANRAKQHYRSAKQIFYCGLLFGLLAGGLMTLFLLLEADWITTTIFKSSHSALPLKVMAPTIFIFSIMGVIRGYFQGHGTMIPTSISQIVEQIINAIISVVASYTFMIWFATADSPASYGAAGGTLGTLSGAVAGLLLLLVMLFRHAKKQGGLFPSTSNDQAQSQTQIQRILIVTLVPIILSQFVYQLSGTVDNAMFGIIMDQKGFQETARMELLGTYSGRYRLLSNVPVAIASALGTSLIPSLVISRTQGRKQEVLTKIHILVKFNMLIAIPCAVGLGVLADPIMELVFRSPQPLAAELMSLGCLAVVCFSLSTVTNAVLQGIDLMRKSVTHSAISLVLHIILVYSMLNYLDLGVYGLVIGNVTFALVVCVLNWISISKALHYRQEIRSTFILPSFAAIIMGGCALGLYTLFISLLPNNTIVLLVVILIAIVIYGILLVVFKAISKEELLQMPLGRTILRRLHL